MSEIGVRRAALARWAKVIYGLAGLELLVITALVIADLISFSSLTDIGLILFFAVTAHAKQSRGCAITVAILGAYYVANAIQFIASGAEFPEPFDYDDEVMWLIVTLDLLITLAAIKCAVEAICYHKATGTRIVWENVQIITFVAAVLCVLLLVFGVMLGLLLPGNSMLIGNLATGLFSLIAAFAIWRKIPGMESLPVVIAAEASKVDSGSVAEARRGPSPESPLTKTGAKRI